MKLLIFIPVLVAVLAGVLLGMAWILLKLWTLALVPFGVPAITYWQAFGIWCLATIVVSLLRRAFGGKEK